LGIDSDIAVARRDDEGDLLVNRAAPPCFKFDRTGPEEGGGEKARTAPPLPRAIRLRHAHVNRDNLILSLFLGLVRRERKGGDLGVPV